MYVPDIHIICLCSVASRIPFMGNDPRNRQGRGCHSCAAPLRLLPDSPGRHGDR